MASDDKLAEQVAQAAAGDMRAFDKLVLRHQDFVLANCRSISGSGEDAQDLAQEVFVKAYFGLKRFEGRSSFGGWLKRIKVNHCLNYLRSKRGRRFVDVEDPVNESAEQLQVRPSAQRDLEAGDERARIQGVLEAMPDTLRLPLIMRDLDGLAYQEIADAMGLGLSAVKMRIKRGREDFRRRFEAPAEEGRD